MEAERPKSFFARHRKGLTIFAVVWVSITLIKLFMGFYFPLNRADWSLQTYEEWAETWDAYEGKHGGIIVSYNGTADFVVVPKYIDGNRIVRIDRYAFDYKNVEDIHTIIVPEGIQYIGNRAFWGCENLQTLYLPLSVNEITANSLAFSRGNVNVITLNPKILSLLSEKERG